MRVYDLITIDNFRGTTEFVVYVEAELTWGGSDAYGSTDPCWYQCEVISIMNPERNKEVSPRLHAALMSEHGDMIHDYLIEERGNYYEDYDED